MQILVKTLMGDLIVLDVEPNEKIESIKTKIEAKQGTPKHVQSLVYGIVELENDLTLLHYGIKEDETLYLNYIIEPKGYIKIFVETTKGKRIMLNVKPNETIARIKHKIKEIIIFPPQDYKLVYKKTALEDHKTLSDFDIHNNSTLRIRIERATVRVLVINKFGKHLEIKVTLTDTIKDLKIKIQAAEGTPPDEQCIMYGGRQLKDDYTVKDYKITKRSLLGLICTNKERSIKKMFVDTKKGKTIIIDAELDDSIKNLKVKIQDKEGTPLSTNVLEIRNQFVFGQTLRNYRCPTYSLEQMDFVFTQMPENDFYIFVKIGIGKTIIVPAKENDTIEKVKEKIWRKAGIPSDNYNLVYDGKTLRDEWTLLNCNITDGSILSLYHVLKLKGGMQIIARKITGKIIKLEVTCSDTILSVKEKIEEGEGIPVGQQVLIFDGKELQNGRCLADYNITATSKLFLGFGTMQETLRMMKAQLGHKV